MDARVTGNENRATEVVATSGGVACQNWPKTRICELIRDLWPVKGWTAITQYAGVPDRTARNYQSGHSDAPMSVLCNLLRGDEGYRVLTFIMCGHQPTWWIVIQHERAVYARLKELSPTLRGIIDDCR